MLSDEDRDALGDWWDDETTVGVESAFPVVHRIVEAHVTAALNDAADAIETTPAELWGVSLIGGDGPRDVQRGFYNGANAAIKFATRRLRNHTPT